MSLPGRSRKPESFFMSVLKAGFVAGTLDILSAFTYFFIKTGNTNVFTVLNYVASGALGKRAFEGGTGVMLAGLAFHYSFAYFFTVVFFLIYPFISRFVNNLILLAVLYGASVWWCNELTRCTVVTDRPSSF